MIILNRFVHLPSGSTYDICVLESYEMKNQAFSLLYRKYIEESKDPWEFPKMNPSNIRIENRTVDGNAGKPVLVDDFEHTAFTLGIVSSHGKVVGTGRLLLKDKMPDGRLEVERYNSMPHMIKKALDEKNCRIEINRLAIDDGVKGLGCAYLLCVSILSHIGSLGFAETIVWTQPLSLYRKSQQTPGYGVLAAMNKIVTLGSFYYMEEDSEPAMVTVSSKLICIALSILRALSCGTILMPSYSIFRHEE